MVIDAGSSGSRVQIYSWLDHDLAVEQRRSKGKSLNVLPRVETGVPSGDGWHSKVTPGEQLEFMPPKLAESDNVR